MIFVTVSDKEVAGLKNLSIDADNTSVNFGLMPAEVIKEVLNDLIESCNEALQNL